MLYNIVLVSAIHQIVKKVFLSEQSKEIEENNRMGKTRDLFKKIKDTQVGHNKGQKQQGPNRSRRDLEAARIHRTVQKKLLMTWIIMMVWSLT